MSRPEVDDGNHYGPLFQLLFLRQANPDHFHMASLSSQLVYLPNIYMDWGI